MTMLAFKKRQMFLLGTAPLPFSLLLDGIIFNTAADRADESFREFPLEKVFIGFLLVAADLVHLLYKPCFDWVFFLPARNAGIKAVQSILIHHLAYLLF